MVSAEIEYLDNEFLWIAFGNDPEGIWYIGIYQIEIISNNQAKFDVEISTADHPFEEAEVRTIFIKPDNDAFEEFCEMVVEWSDNLAKYDELNFVNPVKRRLISYEKEYKEKIEFVESSNEYQEYFDSHTQIKLDSYFKDAQKTLERFLSDENSETIEDIKSDFKDLEKNQTKYSKAEVKIKLARTWAKCREVGITLAVEVTKVVVGEIFKKMLTGP